MEISINIKLKIGDDQKTIHTAKNIKIVAVPILCQAYVQLN